MRLLISTREIDPPNRFRVWQEMSEALLVSSEAKRLGDSIFEGALESGKVGDLLLTRSTFGSLKTDYTSHNVRESRKQHTLSVTVRVYGQALTKQNDRTAVHKAGEIVVLDRSQTATLEFGQPTQSLLIEIPRERIERLLGPARNFSALAIGADQPSTSLATTFLLELARVHEQLSPEAGARMAAIGVDLISGAIAERLAQDIPKSLHGTMIFQRAKSLIEQNLGDPELSPPKLAAAVGVSLRYLHQLFSERSAHISDTIWERRLQTAALRLSSRGHFHLSVSDVAYGCGFTNQAHFSRRFKERFGLTPTEYRSRAMISDGL